MGRSVGQAGCEPVLKGLHGRVLRLLPCRQSHADPVRRLHRVTIAGDLDLTADQQGLAYARQLQQLVNAIVTSLEAQQLPEHISTVAATTVANPFGD